MIAALLALGLAAQAEDYPTRLIKLMHGFQPGGNVDVMARVVGQEMSKGLGQPIVIEHKPGQVGNLVAEMIAKSEPNGYTLLLVPGAHPVVGATYKQLRYKPVDDFAWISTVSFYPFVVCVRDDSRFQTLGELLAAARANLGTVTYGSSGLGSVQFMAAELLANVEKVRFLHVFYRGEAPSMNGLLTGDVDFIVTTTTVAASLIQSGRVRGLGITSKARSRDLPDIPTFEESGVRDFEVISWSGLAAPARTPQPIIDRLNAEVRRVISVPAVKARIESFGGDARSSTPAEMRDLVERQLAIWKRLAQEANIHAE
jgi:tripartite-type tricarboxylate transporter receptor subunit TctC